MKNIKSQTPKNNTNFNQNKNRPEIRDNMDSRAGVEQQSSGTKMTNNSKEKKSGKSVDK